MNMKELLEQLKAGTINEAEFQAKLKELGFVSKDDVEGLTKNRDALKDEKLKAQQEKEKLEKELEQLKQSLELGKQKQAEDNGNIDELKQLHQAEIESLTKKHNGELKKLTELNESQAKQLHDVIVVGGVTEALTKAGVMPEFFDAAKALLLQNKAEIVEGKPMLGGKLLDDTVNEWAASDTGKHFIKASGNSGGGATPSNSSGEKVNNPWAKDTFNLTKQGELMKNNPELAQQFQQQASKPAE